MWPSVQCAFNVARDKRIQFNMWMSPRNELGHWQHRQMQLNRRNDKKNRWFSLSSVFVFFSHTRVDAPPPFGTPFTRNDNSFFFPFFILFFRLARGVASIQHKYCDIGHSCSATTSDEYFTYGKYPNGYWNILDWHAMHGHTTGRSRCNHYHWGDTKSCHE